MKEVYSFVSREDRAFLKGVSLYDIVKLTFKNEIGGEARIAFRVIRNAHLGRNVQWIYGEVQNATDGIYRQIEVRLYERHPEIDSIEMFDQAPPVSYESR